MRTTDKYRREGFRLYEQGMYAQAEAMLLKDLALHPHSPEVWHLLAMCRSSLGKLKASVEAMDQAPVPAAQQAPPYCRTKATALASMGKEKRSPGSLSAGLGNGAGQRPGHEQHGLDPGQNEQTAQPGRKPGQEIPADQPRAIPATGIPWAPCFRLKGGTPHALVCYYRAAALDPSFPKVNQRILTSFKDLSPSQISKLADIPLDLLEAPPEEPPAAGPEKLLVDPLNPKFEPSMGIKESPAQGAAAPEAKPSRASQKPAPPAVSPEPTPPPAPKRPPVPLASLQPKPKAKPPAAKPAPPQANPKPAPGQTQAGGGRQA